MKKNVPEKKTPKNEIKLVHPDHLKDKPLCPMSGSPSEEFTNVLANQVKQTLWLVHSDEEERAKQILASLYAMTGAKPQDELEGMLTAQMVATHNAAMECYKRAMLPEQTFDGREMNLIQAGKLSRTYATSLEALGRYRGKGQQKMTVEHVHVHAGGQAIVGNVNQRDGGRNKKKGTTTCKAN